MMRFIAFYFKLNSCLTSLKIQQEMCYFKFWFWVWFFGWAGFFIFFFSKSISKKFTYCCVSLNNRTEIFNQVLSMFIIGCETFDILNHKRPKHKKWPKFALHIRDNCLANSVEKILTTVHGVSLTSIFLSAEKLLEVLNCLTT